MKCLYPSRIHSLAYPWSDYDHIKWFVVVVQLIVQSEGMVEFRQGGISNGDIIYMLGVSHILGPHVAWWGKELVESDTATLILSSV